MSGTDQEATFAVNLADGTSGPAAAAAGQLKNLRDRIAEDQQAISGMNRALKNLQGGTVVNVQQFRALKAAIDAKKQSVAQAQSSYLALGGSFAKTGGSGKALESKLAQMLGQVKQAPGPLGVLASQFEKLQGMLGGGKLGLALIGIGAALTYVTVKTGQAIAELLKYGIAQADARRSELLRFEGLTKMRFLFGAAAGKATDLQDAVDAVSATTATSRDKVASYADMLYRMQLRGQNLKDALEAVSIKASTQGDAAAHAFAGWAAGAAMTGQSVKRLTDDVKARLGGIAQAQMLSTTVQAEKLHEATASLFSGLKIENLLKGQAQVNALFTQGTNSGKALKVLLTKLLQPFVDGLAAAQPLIKRFYQGLIIGALNFTIALLKVRNWFRKTFGGSELFAGLDKQKLALRAGEAAFYLFGAAIVAFGALAFGALIAVVPLLWGLAAAAVSAAAAGLVLAAPFLLAAAAIFAVINTARLLYDLWKEIDWKGLGSSIWRGIVDGLALGRDKLVDAVTGLGKAASSAFKHVLGISSPSKAFMRFGVALPLGIAAGVAYGQPQAARAVRTMGAETASAYPQRTPSPLSPAAAAPNISFEPPSAPRARNAPAAGGRTVNIGEVHVHTTSGKPREMALDFRRELERELERLSWEEGAEPQGDGT